MNKHFIRKSKDYGLEDEDLRLILDDILKGRASFLGFKMYKIRAALEGKGKSGGFRNIFFWKKDEFIVFCLIFVKNEQENLNFYEKQILSVWSNEYNQLTENEINQSIKSKTFWEIKYAKD